MKFDIEHTVPLGTCVNCGEETPMLASIVSKGNNFCTTLCANIFSDRQENQEKGRKK